MPKAKKQIKRERKTGAGLSIPAGLLIGMGIGFYLNNLVPWLFLGLGAGFLLFLILRMMGK